MQGIKMNDPYIQEVIDSNIPCVFVDVDVEGENVAFVTTDNVFGAQMAVKHLINLGHTEIAMMNGHDQAHVSAKRRKGYERELLDAGLPVREEYILNGEFLEPMAEAAAYPFLQAHPEVTAVFCASDLMALGVIRAAKRLNLKIPEDLSIVGFDDIVLSEYTNPPLTTVGQDKYQMGYEAAKLLTSMLKNDDVVQKKATLDNSLIVRETTAPPHK